jgi:hypothetical protein
VGGVAVVTDSTADLPRDLVEELGIRVVPLSVSFGTETFISGITLDAADFYERLARDAAADDLAAGAGVVRGGVRRLRRRRHRRGRVASTAAALSGTVAWRVTAPPAPACPSRWSTAGWSAVRSGWRCSPGTGSPRAAGRPRRWPPPCERVCEQVESAAGRRHPRLPQARRAADRRAGARRPGAPGQAAAAPRRRGGSRSRNAPGPGRGRSIDRRRHRRRGGAGGARRRRRRARGRARARRRGVGGLEERVEIAERLETLMGPVVGTHVGPGAVGVAMGRAGGSLRTMTSSDPPSRPDRWASWLAATPAELVGLAVLLLGALVATGALWWGALQRPNDLPDGPARRRTGVVPGSTGEVGASTHRPPPPADGWPAPDHGEGGTHAEGRRRPGLPRRRRSWSTSRVRSPGPGWSPSAPARGSATRSRRPVGRSTARTRPPQPGSPAGGR